MQRFKNSQKKVCFLNFAVSFKETFRRFPPKMKTFPKTTSVLPSICSNFIFAERLFSLSARAIAVTFYNPRRSPKYQGKTGKGRNFATRDSRYGPNHNRGERKRKRELWPNVFYLCHLTQGLSFSLAHVVFFFFNIGCLMWPLNGNKVQYWPWYYTRQP